jgi:hypothetical protein
MTPEVICMPPQRSSNRSLPERETLFEVPTGRPATCVHNWASVVLPFASNAAKAGLTFWGPSPNGEKHYKLTLPFDGLEVARQIGSRIEQLRAEASEDDIPWNEQSEACLRRFIRQRRIDRLPSIFVRETGNLRAVWEHGDGSVGFQFMPDGSIHFVILTPAEGGWEPVSGTKSLTDALAVVEALGLEDALWTTHL